MKGSGFEIRNSMYERSSNAVKWNPLSDPTIADNELRADL